MSQNPPQATRRLLYVPDELEGSKTPIITDINDSIVKQCREASPALTEDEAMAAIHLAARDRDEGWYGFDRLHQPCAPYPETSDDWVMVLLVLPKGRLTIIVCTESGGHVDNRIKMKVLVDPVVLSEELKMEPIMQSLIAKGLIQAVPFRIN